ncbi:MAG: drug/metabolite transporter, family [Actinomycetota bacterium]|nr:drug/metabolite transporter, family [Actinomycetota bacterium]
MCFGTTGTAQALGPDSTTPATVGAVRIVVGAALLVVVARRVARPTTAARFSAATIVVGGAIAAYQVTFFAAVDRTGVGVGTVVAIGSAPLFTGVLGTVTAGERVGARWARATGLAVVGVVLLVLAGSSARVDGIGVVLALGAGLAYASLTVAAKRLVDAGQAPERVLAEGFVLAAVALSPTFFTGDAGWVVTPSGIALALFLGTVPTALAYVLFARGLEHLPSPEVATLTLAEPLTAAALGVVVVGERPGALAWLGAALVLAGLRVAVVE